MPTGPFRLPHLAARSFSAILLALAAMTGLAPHALAQELPLSQVDDEGVTHLPALSVPTSKFLSPEAREQFIKLFAHPLPAGPGPNADVRQRREYDEHKNAPLVAHAQQLYPVNIEPRTIAGVRVRIITPKSGVAPANRTRLLLNLHGGGFLWGEGNGALTESIPIAGLGQIKVITVAYREAPEFRFPAASEDVAAVYRELLKDHRASDIGIYGCSAGGILTAEALAWFDHVGLPMPGAIGTFCGSAAPAGDGDSAHLANLLTGGEVSPTADSGSLKMQPYFSQASAADPLVFPVNSPQLLAKFPPTLLIAGSRDGTVSSLYRTQQLLSEAGVQTELHVWDGMWHAFFMDPGMPESRQVYATVVRFFSRHLGQDATVRKVE